MVRPVRADDRPWMRSSLAVGLAANSYFHVVERALVYGLAASVAKGSYFHGVERAHGDWDALVVCTNDEDHEPAGWVVYRHTPTTTIAYAHVDEAFRGLGAWRALRTRLGLRDGQLVNVVLASPQAMSTARKRYLAKHNWGQVLEWLA